MNYKFLILDLLRKANGDGLGLSGPFIRKALGLNIEIAKKQLYLMNRDGLIHREGPHRYLYRYYITSKGISYLEDCRRPII
jgi:predicted transcriptional regulator